VKRIVLFAVLVAFLATGLVSAQEPAPKIVAPKLRHDFGVVFERENYEYSFPVRNQGKADLVIDKVEPG
jgi:hypothetical protein